MKAVVFQGAFHVKVQSVEAPKLLQSTDAIIRVTLSSICGTDMHPYRGHLHGFRTHTVMGHEFVGVVEEVGSDVTTLKPGDRVVASDVIACGTCRECQRGAHYQCNSVSLFGYGEVVGSYTAGGQAERVRVPFADTVLMKIPDQLKDEDALFVGDILATGYGAVEAARVGKGDVVVVVGGGPVGLMAVMCARAMEADSLYVIEPNTSRHEMARRIGAIPVRPDEVEQIRKATQGRGADVVIEAVGIDDTLQLSLDLIGPKGRVVCVGAHHSHAFPLNTELAFAKEITLQFVVGNPLKHGKLLLELIGQGKLRPADIITHRASLEEAEEAYRMFDRQEALKIVLTV